ncbi:hypothetical protein EV401DRAFT_1901699 [Pisolithus croceorrhizus]|nr:hypothetical protein EV401DRAFT_1901699 [Pisolithus croceorrhizus]
MPVSTLTNMSIPSDAANPYAPDSPRSSQSPPPSGVQGDLELELLGLATALYNLERDKPKQVGARANDVVRQLATIDDMSQGIRGMVPLQVLADIDNARNPMQLTKERLERAATENQFMNGKIAAVESYRTLLNEALVKNFPETAEYLDPRPKHATDR